MGGHFDTFVVGLILGAIVGIVCARAPKLAALAAALVAVCAVFLLVDRGVDGFTTIVRGLGRDIAAHKYEALGMVLGTIVAAAVFGGRRRFAGG